MLFSQVCGTLPIGDSMKKQLYGSLCLLLGTLIWGLAFIAQSIGMDYLGPFTFQTVRCALAAVFLFLVSSLAEIKKDGVRNLLRRWADPKLWKAGGICGAALFAASSLQQLGLVDTDPGKAGFLTAMYIVMVPLLGLFLGKRPPKAALFSVLPAGVGLYLLSCAGVSRIRTGDLLLLGCALAFSVQILLIARYAGELDGLRLNCVQALVVSLLSLPFCALTETVSLSAIARCWLPLGFAGILSMGVAYTLQIAGQRNLEASRASLIMSLESVFAALGSWLILKEQMLPREWLGCALVFSAVLLSQLPERRPVEKK